ncbi:MAG: homospermidine synthase [Candidatus Accumulibacter sp. 66-26]|nr:homospermidine synthase [Accumulibacter sp.]OJW52386.1 MAG: homospermidine synthase [Candidatus Accumulibacter sp. 66-26]
MSIGARLSEVASDVVPVVILAVGNPSRGDDALGPLLLDRLGDWLAVEGLGAGFDLIGDFQLQVEHALDLAGRRLALFIDAAQGVPAPYVFRETTTGANRSPTTHALSPEAVLAVLPLLGAAPPPSAFVLGVRGESFVLGEAPGVAALAHADAAFALLQLLCRVPERGAWAARVGSRWRPAV